MRARRRRDAEYPRVIYGPYGASRTIQSPADWIPGWSTTPERADPLPERVVEHVPYSRAELKQRLRAAGVVFDERAADSALYRALKDHG